MFVNRKKEKNPEVDFYGSRHLDPKLEWPPSGHSIPQLRRYKDTTRKPKRSLVIKDSDTIISEP